jgi:Flp pilus assembly protein TadB
MRLSHYQIYLDGPSDTPARRPGLLRKLAAAVVGAAILVGAFMLSVVVLAVLAVAGAIGGAWLFWRTRALRKRVREQMQAREQAQGRVIEGEVIRGRD